MDPDELEELYPAIYENGPTEAMYAPLDAKIEAAGGRVPWAGYYPGTLECEELGWYIRWMSVQGKPHDYNDPAAVREVCRWERCGKDSRTQALTSTGSPQAQRGIRRRGGTWCRAACVAPSFRLYKACSLVYDGRMHPGATHIALLAACVARTTGPVIEFGCGDFSTPLLHMLCRKRELLSLDSDPAWVDRFRDLASNTHRLAVVESWASEVLLQSLSHHKQWDVVFVDQAPAEARVPTIQGMRKVARHIVVHDTEHPLYGYEPTLSSFKYRYDDKRVVPWTTVVSDVEAFEP